MNRSGTLLSSISGSLMLVSAPDRKARLELLFSDATFDFDLWIKTISDQYVLPAVFLQLERAGMLTVLPDDALGFIGELTARNRERNLRIMAEVKEISTRLAAKGIEAVFLKGTAHLLLNLYEDPAERMIGDIDFLVSEDDYLKAVDVLLEMQFKPLVKYNAAIHREGKHYPRMINYTYEAAVEVHRQVVLEPYSKYFKARDILAEKQELKEMPGVFVPSGRHLLIHNMMNAQFNDKAYRNRLVLLRQMYDFMLLAKRRNPHQALLSLQHYKKESNAWLALNSLFFDLPENITYNQSRGLQRYIRNFIWLQNHPKALRMLQVVNYFLFRFFRYISLPVQALFNSNSRKALWARLRDPKWYLNHMKSYLYFFNPKKRFEK